jgi:predicted negative regulator of RcsB-dependent stress response
MSDILLVVGVARFLLVIACLIGWVIWLQNQLDQKEWKCQTLERELKDWKNHSQEGFKIWRAEQKWSKALEAELAELKKATKLS